MAVILNLAANQPPSSIASGSVPATMLNGRWKFTFTPNYSSATGAAVPFPVLLYFSGNGNGDFYFNGADLNIPNASLGGYVSRTLSWSAAQTITLEMNLPAGTCTISGATTGDGTFSLGGTSLAFNSANLYIGYYFGDQPNTLFDGAIGNIEDFATSIDVTVAATDAGWTAAATVTPSQNVAIAATDAGWTAAATVTPSQNVAVAATDAGWTAAAALDSSMSAIVAATDAGWTAAATLAQASSLAIAATDAGWTAAAALEAEAPTPGVLRIHGRNMRDGAGNIFIPRGPELVVADIGALDTIDDIAATGANALRVLLTLDDLNAQSPETYSQVIGHAISHGMVVWISLFSWNNAAVPPRKVHANFGGGTLATMADYQTIWGRQWLKDIAALYDGWIVLDAMQEFINSPENDPAESPAAIAEWVAMVQDRIEFFRSAGYTQPLDVMACFQGRDLAAIVANGPAILAVDTQTIDGYAQTLFGWQAYWGDDWYRGWQGALLKGPGQLITATEGVGVCAEQTFCIMAGLDSTDMPGDESWNYVMPECHALSVGWLWWEWSELTPAAGNIWGPIVCDRLPDGFAGATLAQANPTDGISIFAIDAGWTAAATLTTPFNITVAATDAGWTAAATVTAPANVTIVATDAGWTALAICSSQLMAPFAGAFVDSSAPSATTLSFRDRDTPSNPDAGAYVGLTGGE